MELAYTLRRFLGCWVVVRLRLSLLAHNYLVAGNGVMFFLQALLATSSTASLKSPGSLDLFCSSMI